MSDLPPKPDATKTLLRAFGVLGMLAIAITGMFYAIWIIWHPLH